MSYSELFLFFSLLWAPMQFLVVIFSKRKNVEYILPATYLIYLILYAFQYIPIPIVDGVNFLYLIIPSLILSLILKRLSRGILYNFLFTILCVVNVILILFPVAALFWFLKKTD